MNKSIDADIVKASQFTLDSDDEDEASMEDMPVQDEDIITNAMNASSARSPSRISPSPSSNGNGYTDVLLTRAYSGVTLTEEPPRPPLSVAKQRTASQPDDGGSTVSVRELLKYMRSNAAQIQETEERLQALLTKQQALSAAEQHMEEDLIVEAVTQPLGFSRGRPVAALMLHRCLVRWGSLQFSHSPVVSRILESIGIQLADDERAPQHETRQKHLVHMAYWLTNLATLLHLMDPHMPAAPKPVKDAETIGNIRKRFSGFGRRIFGQPEPPRGRTSTSGANGYSAYDAGSEGDTPRSRSGDLDRRNTVDDAEPGPGSQFRAGLESLVCIAYKGLRDSCKRQLAPLLGSCMLAQAEPGGPYLSSHDEEIELTGQPGEEKLLAMRPWCEVVGALNEILESLKSAFVPRLVLHGVFHQLLCFINAQLFNQLLLRPELCSSANANFMMEGLNHLDSWLLEVGKEQVGESYECLQHIRQAASFLVLDNKCKLTVGDLSRSICPSLNPQQLYRLCTTFWDDSRAEGIETVSGEVLEELKREVPNNGGLIVTFLVEEEHTMPFAPNGVLEVERLGRFDDGELFKGISIPEMLLTDDVPYDVFGHLEKDLEGAHV